MGVGDVMGIFRGAISVGFVLAGPILLFGLVAGLTVSIFQSVTQIQEMTLTFIPKILAVILCLILFMPWMIQKMMAFTTALFLSAGDMGAP